jgi:hypothetical protein
MGSVVCLVASGGPVLQVQESWESIFNTGATKIKVPLDWVIW